MIHPAPPGRNLPNRALRLIAKNFDLKSIYLTCNMHPYFHLLCAIAKLEMDNLNTFLMSVWNVNDLIVSSMRGG